MDSVPVYILSGGHSSRFGSDKARIPIQGEPLLLRLARTLQPFASSLTIVADVVDKYRDLRLRTIADQVKGLGPMGGISAAIEEVEEGWLLVAACDLIDLNPDWIELLLSHATGDIEAVAFKGERWESLPALFHASIRPKVDKSIADRQLAVWSLLEKSNTRAVPLPPDWANLSHINTPEDLAAYEKKVRKSKV